MSGAIPFHTPYFTPYRIFLSCFLFFSLFSQSLKFPYFSVLFLLCFFGIDFCVGNVWLDDEPDKAQHYGALYRAAKAEIRRHESIAHVIDRKGWS